MNRIDVNNIKLYYGDFQALKGISMVIEPQSVTALIGPSGCGKSTFLRCLNRMNDLIENVKITGEVLVDNENIYDAKVDVYELRKKVGMVFQKPTPFRKSIFDNVAYGLRVNGERNKKKITEKVEQSLVQAALWDEVKDNLRKSALELSGGQQQRLCIARTIAADPQIILMDEPTSALDPIATNLVEQLIEQLKAEFTIVIVTHNMQQARRISDKTAFFYIGELIEFDRTLTIFDHPKHERTRNYIGGKFG